MSHWFHRNPLKSTLPASFELKSTLPKEAAAKICNELRIRRANLLEHFKSASTDFSLLEQEFHQYLSLLYGFIYDPGTEAKKGSKLRYLTSFTWSQSILGQTDGIELADSWFELLNLCVQMSLWLMKRAAWLSSKDEVGEADAKQIHTSLRKGAGLFQFVIDNSDKPCGMYEFPGSDLDRSVLLAYHQQALAEAQELTIGRAIELKHSPKLISALANETANMFLQCDQHLDKFPLEPPRVFPPQEAKFEKWRRYCHLKRQIYVMLAHAYQAEALLADDEGGAAIRAAQEGLSCYKPALDLCSKYAKAGGPGLVARPEKHLFFRQIQTLLQKTLEKAQRENEFIYKQSIPKECPPLEEKSPATGTLTKAETFTYPPKAEAWTPTAYSAFEATKSGMLVGLIKSLKLHPAISQDEFVKAKKANQPLPTLKEEKIYETERDPNNQSGCVIS